jgi:hypothetical protein
MIDPQAQMAMLDQGAGGGGDLSGGQLDGGTMTPQEGDVDVQIEQVLVKKFVNINRTIIYYFFQCFGSDLDPDSIRSVEPDPDSESGSGARRAKMTPQKCWMFSLED